MSDNVPLKRKTEKKEAEPRKKPKIARVQPTIQPQKQESKAQNSSSEELLSGRSLVIELAKITHREILKNIPENNIARLIEVIGPTLCVVASTNRIECNHQAHCLVCLCNKGMERDPQ